MNGVNVYKCKSGRTNVSDETRSALLVEISGSSLEARIDGPIRDTISITVKIIAEEIQVSVGTDHSIIHNHLDDRQLTNVHKESKLINSQDLMQRSLIGEDAFFE